MSAISRLRQARNAEQLAEEIEPLAQALAALADETRQTLNEQQQASLKQADEWGQHQQKTAAAWREAASNMRAAAEDLSQAANSANRAARGWTWRVMLLVALTGVASAAATTGLWHWLPQLSEAARRQQALGAQVEAHWQRMTAPEREQMRELMGWPE